jgi:O-antigen/teichoic acid export membrane protein
VSVVRKLVSGSLAAWCRIGVAIVAQILLVPLFLGNWDPETYSAWLGLQSFIAISQLPDTAHHGYLESEFMKAGKENRSLLQSLLVSGSLIAFLFGLVCFLLIVLLCLNEQLSAFMTNNLSPTLVSQCAWLMIVNAAVWGSIGSVSGVLVRVMSPLGHYATMAWWGTLVMITSTIAQAICVSLGCSLWTVGLASIFSPFLIYLFMILQILGILKKEGFHFSGLNWSLGLSNFFKSQALVVQSFAESIRQHGARLILGALASGPSIAVFSTIRTGANIALSGLSTLSGPMLPELMRFLNRRDQDRIEAILASVWLLVFAGMLPCVLVLQLTLEPLFKIWTLGKLEYDPVLFSLFSAGVLVFAMAQPASAILRGNNLLIPQLIASVVSALITVGLMAICVPWLGLRGAGIALLIAEVVACCIVVFSASQWLLGHEMSWPWKIFWHASSAVLVCIVSLLIMSLVPSIQFLVASVSAMVILWFGYQFWRAMPEIARNRVVGIWELAAVKLGVL